MRSQNLVGLAFLVAATLGWAACGGDDASDETLPAAGGSAGSSDEAGAGGAAGGVAGTGGVQSTGGSPADASPDASGGAAGTGGLTGEGGSAGEDAGLGGSSGQAGAAGAPPSGKWEWANPEAFAHDALAITARAPGDVVVVGSHGSVWKRSAAGWDLLQSGTTATLRAVTTLSSGKSIAVGSAGTVLELDGTTINTLATGINDELHVVGVMTSGELVTTGGNVLLTRNGNSWLSKATPFDFKDARAIFGSSSSDLYVATPYVVMHFDGSAWTKEFEGTSIGDGAMTSQGPMVLAWDSYVRKSPGVWDKVACTGCSLHRFEDRGAGDMAWGLNSPGPRKRYQLVPTGWTEVGSLDWDGVAMGAVFDGSTAWLLGSGGVVSLQGYRSRSRDFGSVWTDGPAHAWIAGYDLPGFSTAVGGPVYEVNGGTWTEAGAGLSVHGYGTNHPVIGAKENKVGRFDGTWAWDTIAFGPGENRDVSAVFAVAHNDIYALGSQWSGGAKVARYDGSQWTLVPIIGGSGPLYSPGGGVVYSVDDYGIWRSDGSQYEMIALDDPYSIHGFDAQHVYAGAGLSVYEISTGTPVQFGGTKDFNCWALWALGVDKLMAAGNYGEMLYGTPSGWTVIDSPTSHTIRAIWGTSPSNIWAVGDFGAVLKWVP